mmetsp:Transcript_28709/g.76602  ORF Transcript_28709/g.76602 Transcript_28709/m.76602 type:complete len:286 (+) Transcript_28709:893-1750(+)
MALSTALCPSLASATVWALTAFSSLRSLVASCCSARIWAMSSPSLAISSVRSSMSAVSLSAAASRDSTLEALFSRVCLFVASSALQNALWSASALACSINLTMRSLIIFLTLPNGSSVTRVAIRARYWLPSFLAFACRYAAAFLRLSSPPPLLLSCARDVAFWTSCGRYFWAFPLTSSLDKISWALAMATSSSFRSTWFCSYSFAFASHSVFVSAKIFSSSAFVFWVTTRSPLALAAASSRAAFSAVFCFEDLVSYSILSSRPCDSASKFAFMFISSFCRASSWS